LSIFTKRTKRIVAGTLAGALALSISPILGIGTASAADALPPLADPIGAGNFCENAPTTEPFTDVQASDPAIDEIICLVATGLTTGVTATTYEPNSPITRRQMALFIKRVGDLANSLEITDLTDLPAYDGVPDFLDIAGESDAVKEAIGQLSQADIVQGTTATTYSPAQTVSRRQMAAFINRLQDFLTGDPFTTTGDFFNDDEGDTGEANLNAVASVGIFQGDGAGNVDPGGNLTRRQMAFVLLRYLQVLYANGDIETGIAPDSNATIAADASGPQLLTFDPDGDGLEQDTYTFTGLDDEKEYDVNLYPVNWGGGYEDSVQLLDNGFYMFRDQDSPFDGFADDYCGTSSGESEIVSINGVSVGSECEYDVAPEDGELEIRVENFSGEADSAFLVVNEDLGTDDDLLKLNGEDLPSEPFGVVGPIVWTGGECETSTDVYGYVLYTDHAAGSIITDTYDCTAFYDDADDYFYDVEIAISLAEFDAWVNNGDYVETEDLSADDDYSRTNPNNWDLDDDYPATPDDVTATPTGSDVTVAWTLDPSMANMEDDDNGYAGFCIQLWDVTDNSQDYNSCFNHSDDDPDSTAVIEDMTYTFEGVTPDTYYATVYATSASSDSGDYSDPSANVTTPVPNSPVAGAMISVSAVHTDGDANDIVSNGDQLVASFNEPIDPPNAGDSVTLAETGGGGTAGQLINGTNATFIKFSANTLVIIVGPAGPVIGAPGINGVINYSQVPRAVASSGNTDLDEHLEWDLVGSTDRDF
jgi:hypothetical protein